MKAAWWIVLFATALAPAAAQPVNDTCAGAIPVGEGLILGSNVGAATDLLGSCAGEHDVYYAYTPSCSGAAVAGFCAPGASVSFEAVLTVFEGSCGALVELGCSEFGCGLVPELVFPVVAGQTYLVAVAGAYTSQQGSFRLSFTCAPAPANDTCAGATPIGEGVFAGTLLGASTHASPSCGGINEVWYAYTASCTASVEIGFCPPGTSSPFDTVVGVYTGACGALTEIACSDNACGQRASATIPAQAGQTYYISVGSKEAISETTFVLGVKCFSSVPNDTCDQALPVVEGLVTGSNVNANTNGSLSCGVEKEVWYRYTPLMSGQARATFCAPGAGASFDTRMAAYVGACGSLVQLACDDNLGCGPLSEVTFSVVAGGAYYIAVGGSDSSDVGTFTMRLELLPELLPGTRLIGLRPGGNSTVLAIDTGVVPAVSVIGNTGVASLSGMDVNSGTGTVYASGGFSDNGHFYRLDVTTGAATLVGSTGFPAVPGLAFDPATGVLFGSAATSTSSTSDHLVVLDPNTGAGTVVGPFGSTGGAQIDAVDGLAVDPLTGQLLGSGGDEIYTIDKATGAATLLGTLNEVGTGAALSAHIAGLAFDRDGRLYGSLGAGNGGIIRIDLAARTFQHLMDAAAGSVSALLAPCTQIEPFGHGCFGSGGFVPSLGIGGCARPGEFLTFSIDGGLGGSVALLYAGFQQAALPMGGGCTFNVLPPLLVAAVPLGGAGPGTGSLSVPVAIPLATPPATVMLQAFVVDPGVFKQFSNTNGVAVEID